MAWRYIAKDLLSGKIVDPDLPMTGVSVTETLSGPGGLTGSIPVEVARLKGDDGEPILKQWKTGIWAESDGVIRGGGILDAPVASGSELSLDCVGFTSMIAGQPYTGNGEVWTKVDPLVVVRAIWDHWQSFPNGNLGIQVDDTTSPIRIGEEQYVPIDTSLEEFDTTFSDGPIRLNWWDTDDLGGMIDGYVKQGYFDYREETEWDAAGESLIHRLRLFYPRTGRRRRDLRFVLGENVISRPTLSRSDEEYANEVMLLGAGEGRMKVRAIVGKDESRIRRVAVVTDDTIKRKTEARNQAQKELAKRQGMHEVTQIEVRDHPHAPLGSWQVGDEIRIQGDLGWAQVDQWVRISASTISPGNGNIATLTVGRQA